MDAFIEALGKLRLLFIYTLSFNKEGIYRILKVLTICIFFIPFFLCFLTAIFLDYFTILSQKLLIIGFLYGLLAGAFMYFTYVVSLLCNLFEISEYKILVGMQNGD